MKQSSGTNPNIKKIAELTRSVLSVYPAIKFAYLHGSLTKNMSNEKSDIDIALYSEMSSLGVKFDLKLKLDLLLKKEVDIAFLSNKTDPLFFQQVVTYGKIILDNDPSFRIKYETEMFLRYVDQEYFRKQVNEIAYNYLNT